MCSAGSCLDPSVSRVSVHVCLNVYVCRYLFQTSSRQSAKQRRFVRSHLKKTDTRKESRLFVQSFFLFVRRSPTNITEHRISTFTRARARGGRGGVEFGIKTPARKSYFL